MSVLGLIGILAAFCTTVSFVPQIIKLRKQGGEDLSYSMLFLYLTGVSLWLVYGLIGLLGAVGAFLFLPTRREHAEQTTNAPATDEPALAH